VAVWLHREHRYCLSVARVSVLSRGLHGLGVGGNPAVTAGIPRVCVRTVRESRGVGLKSWESRGDGIDRLQESHGVDCGLRDVATVGLTRYLLTYSLRPTQPPTLSETGNE